MGAAPVKVNTEADPPSAIPLRHFLVGLVFIVAGVSAGAFAATGYAVIQEHGEKEDEYLRKPRGSPRATCVSP